MERRGQASMEFLMTYGWAILAAVLAVGALAYYGVFNPGGSLPDTCVIGGQIGCDQALVNTTGATIILKNGAGGNVNITSVAVVGCTTINPSTIVADGATYTANLVCAGLNADDKFNGKITLNFLRSGKTLEEVARGDLRATVQ